MCVSGQAAQKDPFDITVPIINNCFVDPIEHAGNYEVLSVLSLNTKIRIILKEKLANNLQYVDIPRITTTSNPYTNYRTNWYSDFVLKEIESVEDNAVAPLANNSETKRTYSATTNVLGDTYTEYIRIIAYQTYPETINNSNGDTFYYSLGINSKWTVCTPYGESSVTTSGSSLGLNCAQINLATPQGEYFASLTAKFVGTTYSSSSPLSIGYNINIPMTPFSITYSYTINNARSGLICTEPLHQPSGEQATQVGAYWSNSGYWAYNAASSGTVGDRFTVEVEVKTDTTYQLIGFKSINYKWDYHVTGTGINSSYGIPVTTPNTTASISGSTSYHLVEA